MAPLTSQPIVRVPPGITVLRVTLPPAGASSVPYMVRLNRARRAIQNITRGRNPPTPEMLSLSTRTALFQEGDRIANTVWTFDWVRMGITSSLETDHFSPMDVWESRTHKPLGRWERLHQQSHRPWGPENSLGPLLLPWSGGPRRPPTKAAKECSYRRVFRGDTSALQLKALQKESESRCSDDSRPPFTPLSVGTVPTSAILKAIAGSAALVVFFYSSDGRGEKAKRLRFRALFAPVLQKVPVRNPSWASLPPPTVLHELLANPEQHPLPILTVVHGGNFHFKNGPVSPAQQHRYRSSDTIATRVPENLTVVYFYYPHHNGMASSTTMEQLRTALAVRNVAGWIHMTSPDHTAVTPRLIDTGHLYYPGDEMYNALLGFEWKDANQQTDLFYVAPEDDPRVAPGRLPRFEGTAGKLGVEWDQQANGTAVYKSIRHSVSALQLEHLQTRERLLYSERHKPRRTHDIRARRTSVAELLRHISQRTRATHGPKARRIVYLFTCSPSLVPKAMASAVFARVYNKKRAVERVGRRQWNEFRLRWWPQRPSEKNNSALRAHLHHLPKKKFLNTAWGTHYHHGLELLAKRHGIASDDREVCVASRPCARRRSRGGGRFRRRRYLCDTATRQDVPCRVLDPEI